MSKVNVENREIKTYKEKTVHDGDIDVTVENDGRVSISGYLWRGDGKKRNAQIEYLEDVKKKLPALLDTAIKGTPIKKGFGWDIVWREASRFITFGGLGVLVSRAMYHMDVIALPIALILVFVMLFQRFK